MGTLELFLGPMRSNKTSELIRRVSILRKHGLRDVLVIKPVTDTKSGKGLIETRDGEKKNLEAFEVPAKNPWLILELIAREEARIGKRLECVAIDEGQFFEQFFQFVDTLLRRNYDILIAGLDLDFRGEPFGDMLALTCFAAHEGKINWCIAYCTECGQPATLSQRLIDGKPAPYESELIIPGDSYEPRCRKHFVLPNRPFPI